MRLRLVVASALAQVFGEEVLNQPPVVGRSKSDAAVAIARDNDGMSFHAGLPSAASRQTTSAPGEGAARDRTNVQTRIARWVFMGECPSPPISYNAAGYRGPSIRRNFNGVATAHRLSTRLDLTDGREFPIWELSCTATTDSSPAVQ